MSIEISRRRWAFHGRTTIPAGRLFTLIVNLPLLSGSQILAKHKKHYGQSPLRREGRGEGGFGLSGTGTWEGDGKRNLHRSAPTTTRTDSRGFIKC